MTVNETVAHHFDHKTAAVVSVPWKHRTWPVTNRFRTVASVGISVLAQWRSDIWLEAWHSDKTSEFLLEWYKMIWFEHSSRELCQQTVKQFCLTVCVLFLITYTASLVKLVFNWYRLEPVSLATRMLALRSGFRHVQRVRPNKDHTQTRNCSMPIRLKKDWSQNVPDFYQIVVGHVCLTGALIKDNPMTVAGFCYQIYSFYWRWFMPYMQQISLQ